MSFLIFLIIPLIFIAFNFSHKKSYISALIFIFSAIGVSIPSNMELFSLTIVASVFLSVPLISHLFKTIHEKEIDKIKENKKLTHQTVVKLESSTQEISNVNRQLKERTSEISDLYEVTKEMSKALEFEEVFKTFLSIIKEKFNFTKCKFIILSDGEIPDKKYAVAKKEIYNEKNISYIDIEKEDKKIINKVKILQQSFYYSKSKKEPENLELNLELKEDTLTAIPLISEGEIIGVLIITNLSYSQYFNLLIFTGQFSLQLKKVKLYEKIQELAIKDELTGVSVRRHFLQRSQEEFKRAVKHNISITLLMLDLDHFKQYNDKYGHLVGDRLLKDIAQIIKSAVREIDLVGRYGGEEFAILLPDTGISGAKLVAERIRAQIQGHEFKAYDESLNITASLGICTYPDNANFFDELINYADVALYRAKKEGRNRSYLFDSSKDNTHVS